MFDFDHDARMMIATDRIERLREAAQAPSAPLRLTLAEWLIRAGRRLLPESPERSGFAHEALARRAH